MRQSSSTLRDHGSVAFRGPCAARKIQVCVATRFYEPAGRLTMQIQAALKNDRPGFIGKLFELSVLARPNLHSSASK